MRERKRKKEKNAVQVKCNSRKKSRQSKKKCVVRHINDTYIIVVILT